VLVVSAAGAWALRPHSNGPVAAQVGSTIITDRSVQREVAAIQAQPIYAAALSQADTLALSAPVDPKALAGAGGDPDDLLITLVPVGGAATTRPYTTQDLQASVLTRLLYVSVLRQLLIAKHVTPTAQELSNGREQARYESGENASGGYLFDELPAWYQSQLAQRGADIEALQRALVGNGGITEADVDAAYQQRLATDFTTVCIRAFEVTGAVTPTARAALSSDGSGVRNVGCAPMQDWTPDVVNSVASTPVGAIAPPVRRGDKVALLLVTKRTYLPLSAVEGNVWADLSARYTDLVNSAVEDQLALSKVSVAPQYGTYEDLGTIHGVLPPDALTPPPGTSSGSSSRPAVSPRQQPDPFD
jgi:hypothetical protein